MTQCWTFSGTPYLKNATELSLLGGAVFFNGGWNYSSPMDGLGPDTQKFWLLLCALLLEMVLSSSKTSEDTRAPCSPRGRAARSLCFRRLRGCFGFLSSDSFHGGALPTTKLWRCAAIQVGSLVLPMQESSWTSEPVF